MNPGIDANHSSLTRRRLLGLAGAGALTVVGAGRGWPRLSAAEPGTTAKPDAAKPVVELALGVCSGMGRANLLKVAGAEYIEETVGGLFMPDKSDADFAAKLPAIMACVPPVKACNGFIPGSLKSVGEEAAHDKILAYADIAFKRAKLAGITTITYGSGPSRQIPKGFSAERAADQFAGLLQKMGPLAAAQGVTVSVEPLRAAECNFLNRIGEVAAVVSAANHPAIRITADVYHMAIGGDTGDDLDRAFPLLHHFHIAEKATRSVPGMDGDDFRPWFRVLAKHGWKGRMSIEANKGGDEAGYRLGFATLRAQAKEAGI